MKLFQHLTSVLLGIVAASSMVSAGIAGGAFSSQQICKAGIAVLMGRNPAIMKVAKTQGNVIHLSYVRQDDRKKFSYRCKVEGSQVALEMSA
ncbi:hypothetical protein [Neosynechococcus sphagnicola]|uniref:hypothetical protein n=1 Tax=Neosynechococcus sphagnicola TaxID=1501145 RepID=UPI00056D753B|nr:hypothetical protein [Neosynechococcus sphagnicola]